MADKSEIKEALAFVLRKMPDGETADTFTVTDRVCNHLAIEPSRAVAQEVITLAPRCSYATRGAPFERYGRTLHHWIWSRPVPNSPVIFREGDRPASGPVKVTTPAKVDLGAEFARLDAKLNGIAADLKLILNHCTKEG